MEIKEIEINITELELRLDRLRALYEQYFMGFEKLEPQIQRKDVDRRLQILRKVNLRNTALRFRLNVAVQKYSTYQTYWVRICRQIEEGTYKRHIQKAKARFGEAGQNRKKDQDFDIDVDVDLAELDSMSDDEFLAKLHRDDASPGADDDEAQDTVRPAAIAQSFTPDSAYDRVSSPRAPGSFRDYAPRWEDAPNTQPNHDDYHPQSSAPGSLSPDTQPQAFRPMSVQEARGRGEGPTTDPAPPRRDVPRTPQIRAIPGRRDDSVPPPARSLPVGRPASTPKAAPGELTEDRIRQIYAQYVREKRIRGESTATTTFESVAKSLRTSSAKLRGQHDGKDIDFEVAEKDGRTILRPVVK